MTLSLAVPVFVAATVAVALAAPRMTRVSDALVSRIGLGAVVFGAIFLGASTSLPGIVVTVSAALRGHAGLAAANALGGITAQTMFLAMADLAYRRGALGRDAISPRVSAQLVMVSGLLALVVVGLGVPTAVVGVHATTPLLLAGYVATIVVTRHLPGGSGPVPGASSADAPIDQQDRPPGGRGRGTRILWWRYSAYVVVLCGAGTALSISVEPIATALGLNLAAAGALLTALATSTPELVTALSAARRGALGLAVGDIAGGNAFDVLFLAAADIAVAGALYPALDRVHVLLAGVALLLNTVLSIGFIRGGRGIGGRVAPESVVVIGAYVAVAVALALS